MFESLQVHQRIVVTGAPRSGTHITAKIIAHDTGHQYIDERVHFGRYWKEDWRPDERLVFQSPGLIKKIINRPPWGVFVVLVRRDIDEILASEKRISKFLGRQAPTWEQRENAWYGVDNPHDRVAYAYNYWDTHSKSFEYIEINYRDLESHSLWVPDNERVDFDIAQTHRSVE